MTTSDPIEGVRLLTGDACQMLATLPDGCVDCVVTSPPYWQTRDYGTAGQYGLEDSVDGYIQHLVAVFAELHRVLTDTGTVWLNLADSYLCEPAGPRVNPGTLTGRPNAATTPAGFGGKRGLPAKNLAGIPWRVALALQQQLGYWLRSDVIWHKPNGMPESVKDRPARRHEYLFLLTKSSRYYFDLDPIRRPYRGDRTLSRRTHQTANRPNAITTPWPPPRKHAQPEAARPGHPGQSLNQGHGGHTAVHAKGANPGTVWSIPTTPSRHRHYAAFPVQIPLRCIAAGCPPGGTVCDPFSGSGTTAIAARRLGRRAIAIDINPAYHQIARARLRALPDTTS